MKGTGMILVILLVVLLAGSAIAAPRTGTELPPGESRPGTTPEGDTLNDAQLLALAHRYPAPMPPGALVEMMKRESAGKVRSHVAGASFHELGLCMITVTRGTGAGEAKSANADPLDAASNVWTAQCSYAASIVKYTTKLPDFGWPAPGKSAVRAWVTLMQLARSVGQGWANKLLGWARGLAHDPIAALQSLYDSHRDKIQPIAAMSKATVELRLKRALDFPGVANARETLPAEIGPLPPRDSAVKPFPGTSFVAALDAFPAGTRRMA